MRFPRVLPTALLALAGLALPAHAWDLASGEVLATQPEGLVVREARLTSGNQTVNVTSLVFSEKSHALRVLDSPSPGSTKLASLLPSLNLAAGINGGYFHSDMRPVGLVVAGGERVHPFEKAKLLSGIVWVREGRPEIVRSSRYTPDARLSEALQAGPVLVENGESVPGLNTERRARRTVVATDGKGRWALSYMTSTTLAEAARILLTPGVFGEWTPRMALNLDGGGSSGLWAAATPAPVSRPEFSYVRNYLVVVPR